LKDILESLAEGRGVGIDRLRTDECDYDKQKGWGWVGHFGVEVFWFMSKVQLEK
jgi:hypothetical protein